MHLYDELIKQSLEPDGITCTCLMRFAVQASRTDLLAKCSDKDPKSAQGYMLRIRPAGREKDVDGAVAILDKLRAAGVRVCGLAYNCVLDACICAWDMERAHELLADRRTMNLLDTVSMNTMLKGFCTRGDMRGTQELFAQLRREGLKP